MVQRVCFLASILLLTLPLPAEQLSAVPPGEAVASLHVPEDVEVQLIASEPQVEDPVALAFDELGNLYVVENRGYPSDEALNGRVALLKDTDGDGYYETRTTFAEGFSFPNGVMPWKGGILLTSAPTVYFLKDTNGDGVADVREDFLTGFTLGGSTQLYVSHPTLGLDNWLYFTNGLSGGEVIDPANPGAPVKMGTNDLRFNPLTRALEATSGQAQFGQAFDNYGHRFVCSNRKHISQVLLQQADLARNPYAGLHEVEDQIAGLGSETRLYALTEATTTAYSHAGTFTAACGLVIYRGTALPAPYHDNGFTCDPTSNIVHRTVLTDNGPAYEGHRGEEGKEFLASTDSWFRPVFLANGPDGALYLCDMYRKTIEHPQYLPKDVAAITDFQSGRNMGRIYRIAAKGGVAASKKFVADTTQVVAVVGALESPDAWQRDTAHRLLLTETEAKDEVAAALNATLVSSEQPLARLHALGLLSGLGSVDEATLLKALEDPDRSVREHALRLARPLAGSSESLRAAILEAAADEDARVRFQAALAVGDFSDDTVVAPLLQVARKGAGDPWIRAAVLSGIQSQLPAFAEAFIAEPSIDVEARLPWMEPLARMVAQSQSSEATAALLAQLLGPVLDKEPLLRAVAVAGVAEGIRRNSAYGGALPALDHVAALTASDAVATAALAALLEQSLALAADSAATMEARLRAIGLLGYASFDLAGERLAGLLNPRETQEVHQAAVQSLGMMNDSRVGERLADGDAWGLYSTPIRKAALDALLARPERSAVFITALESGAIPAWSIDPVSRSQLSNHRDADIQARAKAVFSTLETSDRSAVYEDYKSILAMTPNAISGREVFKNNCARCHRFAEDGYDVGPDLTGIRSQPKESILLHIIKPNSEVLAGFENFVVETSDLESYSGIIVAENESTVTIRGALGVENTIDRANIDRMTSASLSLMPEELEKVMTRQEMRDLIGFLKGE
jgi:putative membrane-bound dehydrogenase-like protein